MTESILSPAAVLTVPVIIALVALLKQFGVVGKWSMLAAVLLGVALGMVDYYFRSYGLWTPPGWYRAACTGLLLGLAASGLHDIAKATRPGGTDGNGT